MGGRSLGAAVVGQMNTSSSGSGSTPLSTIRLSTSGDKDGCRVGDRVGDSDLCVE